MEDRTNFGIEYLSPVFRHLVQHFFEIESGVKNFADFNHKAQGFCFFLNLIEKLSILNSNCYGCCYLSQYPFVALIESVQLRALNIQHTYYFCTVKERHGDFRI